MMEMRKYIDRAKLMGALTDGEMQKALRAGTGEEAYMAVLRIVNFAPAEDVAPVVRGRWELKSGPLPDEWEDTYLMACSECGFEAKCCLLQCPSHYCENCGAKMDGDTP